MKRAAALLLSAVLTAGILSGCGAEPAPEQEKVHLIVKTATITMNAVVDPSVEESSQFLQKAADAFVEQYEAADVTIDVELYDATRETEAIVGCFDTPDAADLVYGDFFNIGTYVHTGRVVPLDDIITDDIRADIDPALWELGRVEGKTYLMPFLERQNVLAYNKELFRKAGLEAYIQNGESIQSWTLEEWEEILDTLADNLPGTVYPMMMYAVNDQGDTHIMTLLRSHGAAFFDKDGHFALNNPQGIAALHWLQDGVARGWFPPYAENLEIEDCKDLFVHEQLAVYHINNAGLDAYPFDFGLVNYPSARGAGFCTVFSTGFEVMDNGDPASVQAAKDFVKYIYEHDEWLAYSAGALPASSHIAEEYADRIRYLAAFTDNNANAVNYTNNTPDWRGIRAIFYPHISDLLRGFKTPETVAAELEADANPVIDAGWENSTLHE